MIRDILRSMPLDWYEVSFWSILLFIVASFAAAFYYVYRQFQSMRADAHNSKKVAA